MSQFLELAKDYLGVDIGGTGIKIVVQTNQKPSKKKDFEVTNDGFHARRVDWKPESYESSTEHFEFIRNTIDTFLTDLGLDNKKIKGIGISIPAAIWGENIAPATFISGIKDSERKNFLKKMSENISNLTFGTKPVYLNDGSSSAVYNALVEDKKNTLCLSLGTGLGSAYIDENGMPAEILAELGKISIDREGEALPHKQTGIKGAATNYITRKGIVHYADSMLCDKYKTIYNCYEDKDKIHYLRELLEKDKGNAISIFKKLGGHLAEFIAKVHPILHMDSVIICGGCVSGKMGEEIIKETKRVLRDKYNQRDINIILHEESQFDQAMGSAYYAYMKDVEEKEKTADIAVPETPKGEHEKEQPAGKVAELIESPVSTTLQDTQNVPASPMIDLFFEIGSDLHKLSIRKQGDIEEEILPRIADGLYTFGGSKLYIYTEDDSDNIIAQIKERFDITENDTYDELVKEKDPYKITSAYLTELYGDLKVEVLDVEQYTELNNKVFQKTQPKVTTNIA